MDILQIEALRKLKKLTQEQFAESIGFTVTGYQKMIKNNDLKVSVLEKICLVYSVDILTFFGNDINKNVLNEPEAAYTINELQKCEKDLINALKELNEARKENYYLLSQLKTKKNA